MSTLLDRNRLAKILGMLGSFHHGEQLAAVEQAERLRQDAGLTWHDILDTSRVEAERDALRRRNAALAAEIARLRDQLPKPSPASLGAAGYIAQHRVLLSDWEATFLRDIATRTGSLSAKQQAVVERIEAKTGARFPRQSGYWH